MVTDLFPVETLLQDWREAVIRLILRETDVLQLL
jgi:hypothetical protein